MSDTPRMNYKPWTIETVPLPLVVRCKATGILHAVLMADCDGVYMCAENHPHNIHIVPYGSLLKTDDQRDGTPCGEVVKVSEPKTCKCAAHSYAECICGAWDDLNPHTLMRERDEANEKLVCARQSYADLSQLYDEARKALMESVAYVVHMPGVAAGDEYWTRRMEMAARWRKAAGLGDSK